MATKTSAVIARAIRSAKEDVVAARKRVDVLRNVRRDEVAVVMNDVAMACSFVADTVYPWEYFSEGKLRASFRVEVDSFREDALASVLGYFVEAGYESGETRDEPRWGYREYQFNWRGHRVEVEARLNDADKAEGCRRVVTGEKTEVVQTYEFVCD